MKNNLREELQRYYRRWKRSMAPRAKKEAEKAAFQNALRKAFTVEPHMFYKDQPN